MTLTSTLLKYKPLAHKLSSKFRIWHVEALLNQSADLLERCLAEEREYNTLNFEWKQFQLNLQAELDSIVLEEKKRDNAYFDRDRVYIDSENKFLKDSENDFQQSKKAARGAYDNSNSGASGEGLIPYEQASQRLVEKNIEEIQRNSRADLLSTKAVWVNQDEGNSKTQIGTRRHLHDQKREQTKSGGLFDLSIRIDAVKERLKRNYEDAYDRLAVAKQGLESIYGYEQKNFPKEEKNLISSLAIWNSEAIEWLIAYQQLEQGFTRVVSVRYLLGDEQWNKLGNFDTPLPLHIPSDFFRTHVSVRVRGVGASIIGSAGLFPWTITIGVPKQAVFYRENGKPKPIDQTAIPLCLLGRVENRKSTSPVEIGGLISLCNASPIGSSDDDTDPEGNWSIKIDSPLNKVESFSGIDDILLDIIIVGKTTF
ncbi:hypothetical protein [Spirosoma flavum]